MDLKTKIRFHSHKTETRVKRQKLNIRIKLSKSYTNQI